MSEGLLHIVIMLFVNAYLIWVLVRVIKAVKRAQGGGLYTTNPAKQGCSRHQWDKVEVYESGGTRKVLYCTECGSISGNDTRYFSREAIEKMAAQRALADEFKEAKFLMIRTFAKELTGTESVQAEEATREFLTKMNQMEQDFVVRKNMLMRMDGTAKRDAK